MVDLLVITDGRRHCLEQTMTAFHAYVDQSLFRRRVIVDDSADPEYGAWIDETYDFDVHVRSVGKKRGFAGAIQAGWGALQDTEFVFHLEDDFAIRRPFPLAEAVRVLHANPHLAQMAMRRQAWSPLEQAAGGVVEMHPGAYADHHDGRGNDWLEHRLFFTTNPSVYPRWVVQRGWPSGAQSEGFFGAMLFQNPHAACGYWGQRDAEPWVWHIGNERTGTGY